MVCVVGVLYGLALLAYFTGLLVEAMQFGAASAASDRALNAIKILVLPIVTLMLGYYLSRR
jgi:hypothetical protein